MEIAEAFRRIQRDREYVLEARAEIAERRLDQYVRRVSLAPEQYLDRLFEAASQNLRNPLDPDAMAAYRWLKKRGAMLPYEREALRPKKSPPTDYAMRKPAGRAALRETSGGTDA